MRRIQKAICAFVAAAALLGAAGASPASAQTERAWRPFSVSVDVGYINLSEPPRWIALGPVLEWRPAKFLTVDPEVAIWLQDSFRSTVRFVPGLTANLRFGRVFVGGGLVRRVPEWSLDKASEVVPKLQTGVIMGAAKLALTAHLPGGNDNVILGLTFGTRIGRPGR